MRMIPWMRVMLPILHWLIRDDRYSPVTNFLLTKDLPVSFSSQKREFERAFNKVTEQIVGEQAKAGDNPSCSKAHSVTQTLVSVAENLMKLPSNGVVQNQSVTGSTEQQMATESSDVAVSSCSKLDGVVLSMPDLSEYAPVVEKGVVQPPDVMLDSMYENDPMDEGHATDSPLVDTFDKLLHVENVPNNMLKEVHEPLLEILAPTISPVLGDSEIEDPVEISKETDYSSSSVSPEKTTNVLAHIKSHQVQKRDPKSYGNHRNSNSTKENVGSQKNTVRWLLFARRLIVNQKELLMFQDVKSRRPLKDLKSYLRFNRL